MDFLSIGSMVEVRSDEEEFNGAWYVAKILKPIDNCKGKFLIQYQTLLSYEDPDVLLTASVDIAFIRPLPPRKDDQSYEVHDVVDAFHLGGWWKGVVSKVEILDKEKGKCSKYSVVFENPPEKFDFCPENLRFHFIWTDGNWVQPPKQKRMQGLHIDKGMAVEVNLNEENLKSVWLPGIVVEEVGFNSFLVEYSRSLNDGKDGQMKETKTIDSFRIRRPPPKLEVQNEILECVEAFHDSCWKKGCILQTLTQGWYSVFLHSEQEEIHVRKSEIRPRLLWMNGKWTGFREVPQCEEQPAYVDNITLSIVAIEDQVAEVGGSCDPVNGEGDGSIVTIRDGSIVTVNQCPEIVQEGSEIQELPFTKSSSLWTYLDSDDIFQILPQKPHFRPLFERSELTCEGFAIGHMATFAELVRSVGKLQVTDPRETFDTYLEALAYLEKFGFDVKSVAHRINKLLSIKASQEQLSNESEEIHSKIAQYDGDKEKLDGEIKAIEKKISKLRAKISKSRAKRSKLRAKQAVKLAEKAMKVSIINSLKMDDNRTKEEMSKGKLDFGSLVATPW